MITKAQQHAIRNLPPAGCCRWSRSRKLAVVVGLREGVINADDVASRYGVPQDEVDQWAASCAALGMDGLRVGRGLR